MSKKLDLDTKYKSPSKKVHEINFYYGGVDVEYDSVQAEDHNERCANDYCRCSTLENKRVTRIDHQRMVEIIMENFHKTDIITKYCVERIISPLNEESFYINSECGYYGEELGAVTIDNYDVTQAIEDLMNLEYDNDKIRFTIKNEYGYLLDELKECKFTKFQVGPEEIIFGQQDHYKKLKREVISKYVDMIKSNGDVSSSGIYGVVIKKDDKYRLIDGYHRCRAAQEQEIISKITVFLVE